VLVCSKVSIVVVGVVGVGGVIIIIVVIFPANEIWFSPLGNFRH
jgi:hypothetical protein